jgi:hypothetical protein
MDHDRTRLIAYLGRDSILTVPDSIRIVGESCFDGNKWAESLRFGPKSDLQAVEEHGFFNSSILSVTFPPSLQALSGLPFVRSPVELVYFSDDNSPFIQHGPLLLNRPGSRLIRYFGSEEAVSIGSAVEVIGDSAFEGSQTLTRLTFATGISLKRIKTGAFAVSSLKFILLPASVEFIHGAAFAQCKFESFRVSEDNRHFRVVGSFLLDFGQTKLITYLGAAAEIDIPRHVEVLCRACFMRNQSVKKIRFPSDSALIGIQSSVFARSQIEELTFPASVSEFSVDSLAESSVQSIRIADGRRVVLRGGGFLLDKSGTRLIRYLGLSREVKIPSEIRVICKEAFKTASGFTAVQFAFPSSLERIKARAFFRSSLKTIFIPPTVDFIHGSAFGACETDSIVVSDENRHFAVVDSFLVSYNRTRLVCYFGRDSDVIVPPSIRIFGESSFDGNRWVQTLLFGSDSHLEKLEQLAFAGSSICSITFPPSLRKLSGDSFSASHVSSVFFSDVNAPFIQHGPLLLDLPGCRLIRYFGEENTVLLSKGLKRAAPGQNRAEIACPVGQNFARAIIDICHEIVIGKMAPISLGLRGSERGSRSFVNELRSQVLSRLL